MAKDNKKEIESENKDLKEQPIDIKPEQEVKKDIPKHAFYRG